LDQRSMLLCSSVRPLCALLLEKLHCPPTSHTALTTLALKLTHSVRCGKRWDQLLAPLLTADWFEPTISAGERPQTQALDRAATGTGVDTYSVH
jgi:hypothetical protein